MRTPQQVKDAREWHAKKMEGFLRDKKINDYLNEKSFFGLPNWFIHDCQRLAILGIGFFVIINFWSWI